MDFVEQLKSSVDIVKVVGEYVRLRRVGATGRYSGLCPFHQEKTPSFSVHQGRQFYKCFGCGVGGDVIKFVMEVDGLTFWEALKLLAERNGIPMPKRSDYGDAESKLRGAIYEMHTIAANLYQMALRSPQGAEARAYLQKRGVNEELIATFGLGYSDPGGQALTRRLADERFSAEQLEASGLVRKRQEGSGYYDAFRGRLMFPIHNEAGKVIAFGGRAMRDEDQPKYLNSPETPVYRKTSTLYNLHRAREVMRRADRAVLVEGYMDVIGAWAAGVREVVASCGTALTNPQVRAIHRHADTVIVNFDPDDAGANAAERAIQLLLDESLQVKIVTLDGGLDPDEYVKQNGAEAYRAKVDSAGGYFHWVADRARAKFDMRTGEGRVAAFRSLLPVVQKIPDGLSRAAVANDLAEYLHVDAAVVREEFKKAAPARRAEPPVKKAAAPQVSELERILLNALISSETARVEVLPELGQTVIDALQTREIFTSLRQMADAGMPVSWNALDARLSESARGLLHQIAAADEIQDETACVDFARSCLRRLQEQNRRLEIDAVRDRVKAAAREGRTEEALHWTSELMRLESGARRN